jgi:hypothetical protein
MIQRNAPVMTAILVLAVGTVNLSEIHAKTSDLENRKAQYTVVTPLSETSIEARISSS